MFYHPASNQIYFGSSFFQLDHLEHGLSNGHFLQYQVSPLLGAKISSSTISLATSLPKDSARSANILERVSRTLQDLSSVAAIIIGRVCYLFSSLVKHFPSNFKDYNPKTRTRSYSSLISYLRPPKSSYWTYSFSTTLDISPIKVATARRTIGVSSEHNSVNLVLIFCLWGPLL